MNEIEMKITQNLNTKIESELNLFKTSMEQFLRLQLEQFQNSMKQHLTIQIEESIKIKFQKENNDTHSNHKHSETGFIERQTLSITETVDFMAKLRLKTSKSFKDEMNLLKENPKMNNLESILDDIERWYEGWKWGKQNIHQLTEDEVKAICIYTHDCFGRKEDNFYHKLNDFLRQRKINDMNSLEGYLFFIFKGLDKLPSVSTTIFRGIPKELKSKIKQEYKQGRPIHWSGFSSGTENIETAKTFAGENGIIFEIKVKNGKSISNYSIIPQEQEILMSPNMQFIVQSSYEKDGFTFVLLEEQQIIPPLIF
eukprot:TRINITY_DN5368_c0_g1_i6.p1 TRINITY_DN5368_c0_g1~~TRINITY_DN5368_c0_g1_i6.p1  ORF type:complete len:326 (+),score=113.74 TRINITY_DN5368_c0_g1_i6:48-980(+)